MCIIDSIIHTGDYQASFTGQLSPGSHEFPHKINHFLQVYIFLSKQVMQLKPSALDRTVFSE